MASDGEMSYFLTDHLGSIVAVTDSTGALTSETRYTPFGEVRTDVGTIAETDYGYTNQEVVPDLNLMDYDARMYDASLGRFVQPDTIVSEPGSTQGLNRYAYTNNNPINYNDPTGHGVDCGIGQKCVSSDPLKLLDDDTDDIMVIGGTTGTADLEPANTEDQLQIYMDGTNGSGAIAIILQSGGGNLKWDTYQYLQYAISSGLISFSGGTIIGYSAGCEVAIWFARWLIEQGYPVTSVVLLGADLTGRDQYGNEVPTSRFIEHINFILENGVNVLAIADQGAHPSQLAELFSIYSKGENGGNYYYTYQDIQHYPIDPNSPATNTSIALQSSIYHWLQTYEWVEPEY